MSSKYELIRSDGDCSNPVQMFLYTYANNSEANQDLKDSYSEANRGLYVACSDLLDAGVIDYYEIRRFRAEDYNFANIDFDSNDAEDLDDGVKKYLESENGTGDNLLTIIGGHIIFHEQDCVVDNAAFGLGDEGTCDTSDGTKSSAFRQGRCAWSPLTCSGKTAASAVQEPFHNFIMHEQTDVYNQLENIYGSDLDRFEEHVLGEVYAGVGGDTVTPMLVYHDAAFEPENTCDSDADTGTVYSAHPTDCTIQAMEYMVNDSDCITEMLDGC